MRPITDNCIYHIPEKMIKEEDYMYLGYVDNRDALLVVEEWEFRIYQYEYWSWDSIVDGNHEDEDWWCNNDSLFCRADGCMDWATCCYSVPKFESDRPADMALELANRCSEDLEDDGNCRDWVFVAEKLIKFLTSWIEKIKDYDRSKVYAYYK